MRSFKQWHRMLWGLFAGLLLVVIAFFNRNGEQAAPSEVKDQIPNRGRQSPVKERPGPAPAPARAVQVDAGMRKAAALELVRSEVTALEETLKSSEKARSKVMSKVDNAAVSHVRFLIPMPSDPEILNLREKISDICGRLNDAGFTADESNAEVRRLKDYIDYGSVKSSGKPFKNRILGIDVRHSDGERLEVTLDSTTEEVRYGIQAGTGTPWMKTSGPSRIRRLDESVAKSRFGHLFEVAESPANQ